MALQVEGLSRVFILKKNGKEVKLTDPNPAMSPEDVIKFYASEYPELTTATLSGPKVEGSSAVYKMAEVLGTKG